MTKLIAIKILIRNDDGMYSPGILKLAEIASEFGEVRILARNVEQSSMAHAITAISPYATKKTRVGNFDSFRVNGTPADCVSLGFFNGKNWI